MKFFCDEIFIKLEINYKKPRNSSCLHILKLKSSSLNNQGVNYKIAKEIWQQYEKQNIYKFVGWTKPVLRRKFIALIEAF